jgi:1,4-alpha-glucan branching enzyme
METVQTQGFFVAHVKQDPGGYQLELTLFDGSVHIEEDPYRFPVLISDFDLHLFHEGTHYECSNLLGAHPAACDGVAGVLFSVWAPHAEVVTVVGDFNGWDTRRHPMRKHVAGVWEIFVPGLSEGAVYKYFVRSSRLGHRQMKADPCGWFAEVPPKTGSVVADLSYEWNDSEWMDRRASTDWLKQPMSIYEVHLGSWRRGEGGRMLTYRELADQLVAYARDMGYTHIELMPMMEHPFSGSWGYQVTGFFAPTSRHGSPSDFKYFIDRCHQAGIGVIADWVPAHFPKDDHGLAFFDGTDLYEHEDPRQGEHRDWGTLIFNYGRNEVRSFLISSAMFWLKEYHIDGLRVDAVASMLYLDYSRQSGDWIPNKHGGNLNLEAIEFIKIFNQQAHQVPGALTFAEESTSFPAVSHPVYAGGLGFTLKWNMGWMHDMLSYISQDPVHRKYHHQSLTFSLLYAFTENFVLPISHDEVVHLKRSFLGKMPGDEWQRFANARLFLAYMYAHPGKKLTFMGSEIGQYEEWNEEDSVRWHLTQYGFHRQLQAFNRRLNWFYREQKALFEVDFQWTGFEWIDIHDFESSVISFLRWSEGHSECLVVVCNFTPIVRSGYRVGVPRDGFYEEVLNSDSAEFGGSNVGNLGGFHSEPVPAHGRPASLVLTLPPLGAVILKPRSSHG